MRITWLGHATFLIETGRHTIYIDPYLDPYSPVRLPKATAILISHWHPDHCTRESVEKLLADNTAILGTADAAREFYGCVALREGETKAVGNLTVMAMPASHERGGHAEEGFVIGFWIDDGKKKLYYTSDTAMLSSMQGLKPDVVIIPVGGTTTMRPAEAAKAVHEMGAKLAIPAHWGSRTGTRDDAELFKEYLEKEHRQVVILDPGQMIDV